MILKYYNFIKKAKNTHMNQLKSHIKFFSFLLLNLLFISAAQLHGAPVYSFENGTNGWWSYASKNSSVKLSCDKSTGAKSKASLKVDYKYGGTGSYLGIGIQPKWSVKPQQWKECVPGYFSLGLKSSTPCRIRIEFRTKSKNTYRFSINGISPMWGIYSMQFSDFKAKNNKPLDLTKETISQIVIVPYKSGSKPKELWVDSVSLTPGTLPTSSAPAFFGAKGKILTNDDIPVNDAKVSLLDYKCSKILGQATSDANGNYTIKKQDNQAAYTVDPPSANTGFSSQKVVLKIDAKKYAEKYKWHTLKKGFMPITIKLEPRKTLQPLRVVGNVLKNSDNQEVWLQGLCIDSLEWSATGDNMLKSTSVAVQQWKANCIRIPVKDSFWFGKGKYQKDKGKYYRNLLDNIITYASTNGVYVVIDLHKFGAPMPEHVTFWKDVATRYKNNPAVIFELFNEPHGISWNTWKNGGDLKKHKHKDKNVAENNQKNSGNYSPGMQALVNAVRETGANNLIIVGGLDWSYNLSGILKGYALKDHTDGNGIMYSSHIYPWKAGWQHNFLDAAEKYPLFIGEVGDLRSWDDFKFIPQSMHREKVGNGIWAKDMIGTIQKHRLNWTAFSFHPRCGPMVISDWNYTPTPYWGIYVKQALVDGKTFKANKIR